MTKSDSRRKATALVISASPPQRPSGVDASTARKFLGRGAGRRHDRAWRDGVDEDLVGGQFERERLGQADDAHASQRSRAGSRCSAAGRSTATQSEKLTIRPPPAARRCGTAACAQRNAALRSTSTTASHAFSSVASNGHGGIDRRHVDEDVEAAQRGGGFVHEPPARGALRQIGADEERPSPGRTHRGPRRFRFLARSVVRERDVDAAIARGPARSRRRCGGRR